MTTKQKAKIYEKRVLKAIKNAPVKEGYRVICVAKTARELEISVTAVRNAIKRLEKKNIIETKKSFALFETMRAIGIRFLTNNEKHTSNRARKGG